RSRPSTAAPPGSSCRTSTSGRARSGCGSCASWTVMRRDSGSPTAITTMATRGVSSATTVTREVSIVRLTPRDIDKLLVFSAGELARKRLARGVKLNHPEAIALITSEILELIRDGKSVAEIMSIGPRILPLGAVMEGVADMVDETQVEGTFPDGTKLVTIHQPIR